MSKAAQFRRPVVVFFADANFLKSQLMISALGDTRHRISAVGSAVDSIGAREGLRMNRADVAVVNSELRDGPLVGFDVTREVRVCYPSVQVVMLVDFPSPAMVVEVFRAGAHGVLSREDSFETLCKCIHAVHEGQIWANSEQLHFVTEALVKSAPPAQINGPRTATSLTRREENLVQLVTQGLTNRDIARQLNLSEHTVRNYLVRVFNKLGTSNRLELALYVLNRRLIPKPATDDVILAGRAS